MRTASYATFWALSDPVRVEILDQVAAGTAVTVTQLSATMPTTRQAVSRHVKTLQDAGLLVGRRSGREHVYRVDLGAIDEAGEWLRARTRSWEGALRRLGDYLESGDV